MPITLPEVAAHLESIGWKHRIDTERQRAVMSFGTEHYVDLEGDKSVWVFLEIEAKGAYVQVVLPKLYNLTDCKFKGATLAALAEIAFRTRSLQCEYDSSDGEVRYSVDTWVLDNTLTETQVEWMVRIAVDLLEEYDPVVRCAMQTGRVDFSLAVPRQAPSEGEGSPAPLPPEVAELIKRAGGIEGLRALLDRQSGGGQ